MALKNKEDIPNYEEKAKFLQANGWQTWYHDDNWVEDKYFDSYHGPDRAGCSTEVAYASEKGLGALDDLVQVKSLNEEDFRYKNWTTVTRFLALGLQGVEMREMPDNDKENNLS